MNLTEKIVIMGATAVLLGNSVANSVGVSGDLCGKMVDEFQREQRAGHNLLAARYVQEFFLE